MTQNESNELASLMRDVAAAQRVALARAGIAATARRRIAEEKPPRHRTPLGLRLTFPALGALAAAGMAAVAVGWWTAAPTPLSFAVGVESRAGKSGQRVEADGAAVPVRFSDGTTIDVGTKSAVEVLAVDGHGATVELTRGRVALDVQKTRHSRWHVRAGQFDVKVTGTRFLVDWKPETQDLAVTMLEGRVEIRAPLLAGSTPVAVSAGQRFTATGAGNGWRIASVSAAQAAAAPQTTGALGAEAAVAAGAAQALPGEAPPAPEATRAPRAWQELARDGQYDDALAMAKRADFDDACERLGVDDLVLLGDVARLARDPQRAAQAYGAARVRFPAADRPVFALGLVAFEQQHDYRGAAGWFDRYVSRYPSGPLAREAAGRALESWHRAGDRPRALKAARTYLKRTPKGPYAPLARRIAGS